MRSLNYWFTKLFWCGMIMSLTAAAHAQAVPPPPRKLPAGSVPPNQQFGTLVIAGPTTVTVKKEPFGMTPDGQAAELFTLDNGEGVKVKLTNYGARIVSVETPDRAGKSANIVLGFDKLDGYLKSGAFFGCTTGRFCNRIAKGKFTLDGKEYTLAVNNPPNHLHGGKVGFDRKVWKADIGAQGAEVTFKYVSVDGEEGFPGALDVTVRYTLTGKDSAMPATSNALSIYYEAQTDKPTVLNLTNHCYWNLGGRGSGDVLATELTLAADKYLPTDKTSIPTGEIADVKGTVMDFTKATAIGARIGELKKDPEGTKGYDHCFVLRNQAGSAAPPALAARAKDPKSGRVMEVYTTEPGVQLYIGNFLDGDPINGGFKQHEAFCLETQHYPDAPNKPSFPTTVLRPGQTYRQTTTHRFLAE